MPTRLAALIAALLALALAACGDEEAASTNPAPAATQAAPAAISTNLQAKPEIGRPAGEPPTRLVKEDVVVGKGRAAKRGDRVTVQYVGVTFSHGDQIDASWDRGEPFTFRLGEGSVIPGWDRGIPGMRVGGRRKLTIPADLAYGAQGQLPAIPPNEPLVFVVDLKRIG